LLTIPFGHEEVTRKHVLFVHKINENQEAVLEEICNFFMKKL